MNKSVIKKSFLALIALLSFSLTFHSCDSWMSDDDDFYEEIENEVKRANAPQISVFVRYAATKMGKTDPDGYSTFKVEIPSKITATTEIDYGFKRWAAFSTSFLTPGDTQYTDFVYEDDESYAANYGQYELSSDIVRFEDPNATTTNVTIFEERNDIYIVPVVAKRPTIALSMPASGSSGIVRNMTVRINFSKPMNPASFKNTNGVVDKITITQGTQSITSDGDIEISSTEITDRFAEPTFSTNGKMITLKFKPEAISEGFTAQSYVTINISKDVTDIYGYAMAEDYKLQFQVGSSFDTLAPRISELTAGIAQAYNTFGGVYKDADTVSALGSLTQIKLDGAAGANADIDNNPLYTDALLAQRIKGKVNIRVVAEDLAGSGSGQDATGAESEVSMIGIKATSIALMSGAAAGESDNIPIKSLAYVGQTNSSEIQGSYRDITGANKGFLFTYDVSSLPDGLIKIDVWAYDSIGNSGLLEGGAYSAEYGNGYASIFVVKDTTPPDATANTGLVSTSSASAPYGWYNASTLASMKLYEASEGSIFDNGHPRLRSKSDKLQWFFNVTSDTSWAQGVSPDDARWVNVSDGYSIANAAVPASDGPVALSLILKDDLGNISTAAPLSSIMYDNTAALVSTPTWVNDDGTDAANNVTGTANPAQILKVPFDGNISGVHRLGVYVDKCQTPLANATILYAANGEAPNAATVIAGSQSGNIVELPDSYLSGVFYIKGLTIGGSEGLNTVSIDAYDSALNKSATVTRTISVDTNPPTIESNISVGEEFESTSSDDNVKHYIPNTAFVGADPIAASLSFTITETGSGIHAIKISGGNVEFIPGSTSISGLSASDYTVVSATEIQLPDSYNPKIFGTGVTVTINNVKFKYTAGDPRNGQYFAELKVEDFLNTPSAAKQSHNDFFIDNIAPTIASVEVSDKESKSVNGFTNPATPVSTVYTDSSTVTLKVTVGTEDGSGVYQLVLADAVFTNTAPCTGATAAGSTVTFAKPLISGTEVTLSGVQLTPESEGAHTISVTPIDRTGWTGTAVSSNSIIFDQTAPAFSANPFWTATPGAAVGIASGDYLDTQILNIPFTEATTGIKKFRISLGPTIENPIVKDNHLVVSYNGTEIPQTDYSVTTYDVDGDVKHYGEIELNTPVTTGTLTVQGLHANIATDNTYIVTVALMDAAQNSHSTKSVNATLELTHDRTNPIVEKIEIPGLRYTKEIAQGVSVAGPDESWWIDHEYIGGNHDGNYAATQVPLYITINEKTSGVNLITLGGTMKLQANSTLWMVSDNDETPVEVSKYTVNTTANTITINNPSDSLKGATSFVILIKDLMATETGGDSYSANTVSVTVEDVALNESIPNTTITKKGENTTVTGFYTDSLNCALNGVEIIDRGGTITATAGYTNESIVDVYVNASAENKGYSGHNKFKLTGGKFTADSKIYIGMDGTSSSNALVAVKSAPVELTSDKYVISDDKTTIEFRNAAATEYYVIRNHLALKFTNIQLDNPVEGDNSVTCQPYDLVGWEETSAAKTGSIILDTIKPEWHFEEGTFAATSGKVNGTFIYPHPNGDTAYGIPSTADEKNNDGEIVRYYYTASKVSGTDDYGVIVGIGGKDANLRGYDEKNGVPYYICDTTSVSLDDIDANYVVTHGSMPIADCNGNTTGNDSEWKTAFNGWETMKAGNTYSIVIVDEAGNYSEKAKTIKIVEDTTKPSVKLDGSISLAEVFTLDIPPESKVFINQSQTANSIANSSTSNNLYDSGEHSSTEYYSTNYVIKETSDDYKIVVKLSGRKTGDTMLDGTSASSDTSAYTEKTPTATDSGLAYYAVSHWYADWCTSSDDTSNYYPAFPSENSNVPNGSTIIQYMEYTGILEDDIPTGLTSKCSWHPYTEGNYTDTNTNPFDTINSSVDSDGNISISIPKTEKTPPLALLLKDNCGNMNYILIRPKSMETDQKQTISYIVDNKLGGSKGHCETENGRTKERAVLINPGIDKNGTGATVGTHTFAWGNQSSSYKTSANHGGVSVTGRLVKNLVTNTTYYNDNAWLCLSVEGGESILFDSKGPTTDTTQYTGRAKLYLSKTELSDSEAYATISEASTTNGIATDWNYYTCSSGSDTMHFVFQYPHPDYAALGWASNEPFYIYYLVEDYVGNYDIHKVVNDDSDKMDKWVYDNVAPVLTLVDGTEATKSGDYYLFNPADISKLLPENNGYRAYKDGSNIYVSMGFDDNHLKPRTGATQNLSVGEGTTRHVEGSTDTYAESRKNLMFYDIKVDSEASGIRAFCYSTDATSPGISAPVSEGNTQGDKGGVWYEGFGAVNIHAEIGCDWTYSTDNTNRYDTSEIYRTSAGEYKYSGTKINTIVPHSLIKDSTSLYLHVMDWVGNISTYKMGNIPYVNDAAGPGNDGKTDTNIYKDDHNITSYDNTPNDLQYTFAATKIPSDATSIKIYMPEGKYADAGSGLLGWSLTPNDFNSVKKDELGSYIEITGEKFKKIKNGQAVEEPISVYVYDNVGNCPDVKLILVGDKEPNEFTIFVRPGDTNKLFYITASSSASSENQNTGSESSGTEITSLSEITAEAYTNDTNVTYLAQFKDMKPADDLRTLSIDRYTGSETETYDASKWKNVQKWETGNTNTGWFYSNPHTDEYYYLDNGGSPLTTDSNYLYYRLVTQDKAGNTNYAYVKVATDTTAPTVTLVEGSITGVNNVDGTNYFNSNSKAKLKYADTGSGLKSYTGVDSVTDYVKETEGIEVNLGNFTPSNSKLSFTAKDNVDNGGSINLIYNGSETWVKDTTKPTYTSVANQNIVYSPKNKVTESTNFTLNQYNTNRTSSIYAATIDGVTNLTVNKQISKFTFKLPSVTDENFYGWKVQTEALHDSENYWFEAKSGDGVKTYSSGFVFGNDGDMEIPSANSNTMVYFYPIDKAGNVGTAVILKFVDAPLPVITNVTPVGFSNNCYNGNSSVKLDVKYSWGSGTININSVGISDGTNYSLVNLPSPVVLTSVNQTSTITEISLNGLTGSTLEFELITDVTSSVVDSESTLSATYDNLGPSVSGVSITPDSGKGIYTTTTNYYSDAKVNFSVTDSCGVKEYAITTSATAPTEGWTAYTNQAQLPIPDTGNGTAFYIHFKDNLNQTSYAEVKDATYTTNKWTFDNTAPIFGKISNPSDGNGSYFDSANNTLYYKDNLPTLSITSGTDSKSGFAGYTTSTTEIPNTNDVSLVAGVSSQPIYAVDKVGNRTAYTLSCVQDNVGPTNGGNFTVTLKKGSSDAETGDYVLTDNIYYYNADVTALNVSVTATDTGSSMPDAYLCYSIGEGTKSTPAASPLSIEISSLTEETEYKFYAVDKVGNYSDVLDSVKVKKHITGPGIVGTPFKPPYSGLSTKPTYNGAGITAIPAGNSYAISSTLTSVSIGDGVNVFVWDNGEPKEIQSTNGYTTNIISSGSTFTFPVSGLPSATVYCELTYNSVTKPSFSNSYTVNNNTISGVPVDISKLNALCTFIFVWFKDELGNISVYNVTNPNDAGQNWWTNASDATSNINEGIFTLNGPSLSSRFMAVASSAASSIKSLLTPKSKKVDLTAQSRIADKSEITNNNRAVTSVPASEIPELVKKSELPSAKAKPVKNQPARTKKIASRSADSIKVSSVSTVSPVLPENAKVLEAKPIQLSVENEEHITNVVENNPSPQRRVPLSLVIFTTITVIVIAGMFITSTGQTHYRFCKA